MDAQASIEWQPLFGPCSVPGWSLVGPKSPNTGGLTASHDPANVNDAVDRPANFILIRSRGNLTFA